MEQERFWMADLQREVDTMRTEMVNTDGIDVWSQEMEGAISPILAILDDQMKNWRCGVEFLPICNTAHLL